MSVFVRRAGPMDVDALVSLLSEYYDEWHILIRDPPGKLLKDVRHPALGVWVAEESGGLLGCILIRDLPQFREAAELKRLYVKPARRGQGLASRLVEAAERASQEAGYRWLYLDSKDEFVSAQKLYRGRDYQPCDRYNDNPQATVFFRKRLMT